MFIRDLESQGLKGEQLLKCLTQVGGSDIEHLEKTAKSFTVALSSLSEAEQALVLERWVAQALNDPVLAEGVLLWTNYGRDLPPQQLRSILESAVPRLLMHRDLRRHLLSNPNLPHPLPPRLAAGFQADERESRQRQDEEAKHRRDRQDYFRLLAEMPFEKRVSAIVGDRSIDPYRNWREWKDWASEWSRCSDEEIEALSAESTQRLIDLCEDNLVVRFSEVLPRLYDRRHQLRQMAMDEIQRKYSLMSLWDQLTELVVATSTPIAHFPVELANVVSDDWLGTIPEKQRADFLAQISGCKLRVWVKARQRLPLQVR